MSGAASLMSYVGPVAEAFVRDQRCITAIMGPFGSAKTTSCIRKIILSALWQNPGPDGVRRVRWCCVRDTYPQLEANVMESWFSWFPKTKDNWNGKSYRHTIDLRVIDETGSEVPINIDMHFKAMGDRKAEDVLKGLELTGLWLNETDTLDMSVFLFGWPRTGRYPSAKDGGCNWRGVICDFNAPDIDNWTYDFLIEQNLGLSDEQIDELKRELGANFGVGFYRQPGGRSVSPPPENLHNLPKGYYPGLILGYANKPNYLKRFVDNEFGAVFNGQPVFPEFNRDIHVVKGGIAAEPGYPIHGGLDGGRTPALILFQLVNGQMRVLNEVVVFEPQSRGQKSAEDQTLQRLGPKAFADMVREFVATHYPDSRLGTIFYDPAADYGDDDEDASWLTDFKRALKGAQFRPGGKERNLLNPRLEAVRDRLVKMTGGRPDMLISDKCRQLVRGFAGGYVIERVELSNGTGRFRDKPTKNDFSHVMDALQYGALGAQTRAAVLDDLDVRARQRVQGKVRRGGYAGAARL